MTVKDFILQIADGSLKKDDILNYANKSWDIKELLWDLHLSNIAIDETLGKPLVTGDTETNRIFNAIEIISKQFDVSICNETEQQCKDDDKEIQSFIITEDNIAEVHESDHYNSDANNREIVTVYYNLKQYKYIAEDTTVNQWVYMCTGAEHLKEYFAPIKWNKEQNLLVLFIDRMFNSDRKKWKIATNAFRILKETGKYEMIKHDNMRRSAQDLSNPLNGKKKKFLEQIFKINR